MAHNIIVTGTGRGLGFALAKKHLESGDNVFGLEWAISVELKELGAQYGDRLTICECDIGNTENVESVLKKISEKFEHLDVLYNVAGIYRFEDRVGLAGTDIDKLLDMYNINAVGPMRMCRASLGLMRKGTVIVNISSEAASITNCWRKDDYSYSMAKAALNMGSRILANELSAKGVRVVNLHPGWLKTPMGGLDAYRSDRSVEPDVSADGIMKIALNIDGYPPEKMFMEYTGEPMPW